MVSKGIGFAFRDHFLQGQPAWFGVGTVHYGTEAGESWLATSWPKPPNVHQHPGCLTDAGQVAASVSLSRFPIQACDVLEGALHGSQET